VRVLGYTWAAVRTSDLNSSSRFFSDILGLRCVHEGKGFVQFGLPSGQLFGVFASESRYYQFHNCPVVGFQGRRCACRQAGIGIKRHRVHV
jgi:catechol 2,3-dioxygenase-like lactoylglutathione lyase family enzyme